MHRLWLWIKDRQNRLWVTPMIAGLIAVLLAFSANWVSLGWVGLWGDKAQLPKIDIDTINDLLSVIASSMLAVAIFSLGTLVSALSTSAANATPRATELLMGDAGARASIGSFIASFIFAIVAKTALAVGYYDDGGRFVLFLATLAVLGYVVVRLLLWVRSVSTLGRLSDTVKRIERVTADALSMHARKPFLGACRGAAVPEGCRAVRTSTTGYLANIDVDGLQSLAEELDVRVHVSVRPGTWIDPQRVLAWVEAERCDDDGVDRLKDCFVVEAGRSYEQDPRFGLIVLGEVALRALSPAVNDPGTAISVMSVMTSLLVGLVTEQRERGDDEDVRFDRVSLPELNERTLVTDGFAPIARDGATMVEVGIRLQKMLAVIAGNAGGELAREARQQAESAHRRAIKALEFDDDRQRITRVHRELFEPG